jgi:hypothetical protein
MLLPLTPRTHTLGSGQPLAAHIRNAIEHSLHVDLSSVRVHHDTAAQAKAVQLSARAFTYGHDIFLGPGEHPHDLPLLAHEAAHVVQQQAAHAPQAWSTGSTLSSGNRFEHEAIQASSAVQRGDSFTVQQRVSTPSLQRLGISDALDYFAGAANNLPGFSMLTVVIGFNPINMANVDRSPANILRAVVEFIPGGHQITEALNKYGVFEKVGNWISDQLKTLGDIGHALHTALDKFLDTLSWKDIFHLGDLWDRFVSSFTDPINRIKSFLGGLASGIWDLVRPVIMPPIASLAESIGAWPLLCAVLGKNPITGDKVDGSADALIGGFMHLIGQDEIYTNIKQAKAGPRALAWFKTAMNGMVSLVSSIPDRFLSLVHSLDWSDIIDLPSGFRKVASAFGSFAGAFFTWAGTTIWDLLQIIFEVVAPAVMPYLKKLGASFKSILKNPMGFVRNLVAAGKLGFQMFFSRFGQHLKASFIEWLTGSMPSVYIPKAFTLEEIVKFVLSVLGLTWANIRGKLVKVVGETAVVAMEKGFAIVKTLVKDGPAAAWEQIKGELGNLRDMVLQSVMSFLVETVVSKAVEKLASLLIPAAAFIQAIVSIYNTIMVFVQKLAKIVQVVKAFLDGMMEIAAGSIAGAAAKVESTLAGLLSLSINFMAGFLGLNNVAAKVMGIINDKVRAPIDKALDKAIAWIVAMAKKLFSTLFGKQEKPDDRTEEQKTQAKLAAIADAEALVPQEGFAEETVRNKLVPIKSKYKLLTLDLLVDSDQEETETIHFAASASETVAGKKKTVKKGKPKLPDSIPIAGQTTTVTVADSDPDPDKERLPENAEDIDVTRPGGFRDATNKDLNWSAYKGKKQNRRHVVSSQDMAEHYRDNLKGITWTDAAAKLQKAEKYQSPTVTPKLGEKLSTESIIATAQALHREFFNDVTNLFVGPSRENFSIGRGIDTKDPAKQGEGQLEQHIQDIKRSYAIGPLKITGLPKVY